MSENKQESRGFFYYFNNLVHTTACFLFILLEEFFKSLPQIFRPKVKKNISGQNALVTGGSNGLGRQICIELAKNGCNVAVADIDVLNGKETVNNLIEKYNVKAKFYEVDVGKYEEIQHLKTAIEDDLGSVDILVNNAAVLQLTPTLNETTSAYETNLFNVNFLSHIWTLKTFFEGMRTRKRGHIVSICSVLGLSPIPLSLSYCASKYAINGFMQALRLELLMTREYDFIKTTTVYPYLMETNPNLVDFVNKNNLVRHWPSISVNKVAKEVLKGILENKDFITLPGWYPLYAALMNNLPNRVMERLGEHFFDIKKIQF